MKHYIIQPTVSKPNAIKTCCTDILYVAASPGSAIAIYRAKLRGCAIAEHGADTGTNTFLGHASGQFTIGQLHRTEAGVSHLQIARSQAKASLIKEPKKSKLSNLSETPLNPAHCIQAKCNEKSIAYISTMLQHLLGLQLQSIRRNFGVVGLLIR